MGIGYCNEKKVGKFLWFFILRRCLAIRWEKREILFYFLVLIGYLTSRFFKPQNKITLCYPKNGHKILTRKYFFFQIITDYFGKKKLANVKGFNQKNVNKMENLWENF
jgi:hypothetical protein